MQFLEHMESLSKLMQMSRKSDDLLIEVIAILANITIPAVSCFSFSVSLCLSVSLSLCVYLFRSRSLEPQERRSLD
jgi:hypothetical protein